MWSEIIFLFRNYIGNGLAAGLFALSFLYLSVVEKEKTKRIILLYTSFVILALFFCPLFAAGIFRRLESETYYRILWLVPMTAVIAYAGVRLVMGCPGRRRKTLAAFAVCAAIAFTGDYIYDNPFFHRAENRFHIPQVVVLLCDAIIVDGWEVQAAFPDEMLIYVRQYSCAIRMPYGREMQVERWGYQSELYEALKEETLDCEKIATLAAREGCQYIIVNEAKKGRENFDKNGYRYVETIAGYCIYLQEDAYLGPYAQAERQASLSGQWHQKS